MWPYGKPLSAHTSKIPHQASSDKVPSQFTRSCTVSQVLAESGVPVSNMFYMEVRLNGKFFGLFSFVEMIDSTFLEVRGRSASKMI